MATDLVDELRDVKVTAMDWRMDSACRDKDPELFFPVGMLGEVRLQIDMAKAVCRHCPVSSACLDWAVSADQQDGIWGGLTTAERRRLVRRQRDADPIRRSA